MKTYLQDLKFEKISTKKIVNSNSYVIGFETEEISLPIFIFFREQDVYYPLVLSSKISEIRKDYDFINAFVSDDILRLILLLASIRGKSGFNNVEKLRIIKILKEIGLDDTHEVVDRSLEKYLSVLQLNTNILNLIANNKVTLKIGVKLAELSVYNAEYFADLINKFGLNNNEQKEVLSILLELVDDAKNEFESLLDLKAIKNKVELLNFLRNAINPQYYTKKNEFNSLKKDLMLPKKINLVETPYFESKNLKIEFFFKNFSELEKNIKELKKTVDENKFGWEKIFSIL